MTHRVLFFAQARDRAGVSERSLELPAGSRLSDAIAALKAQHPAMGPLWPHLAIAVNGELAVADAELPADAELAVLPPVSGG